MAWFMFETRVTLLFTHVVGFILSLSHISFSVSVSVSVSACVCVCVFSVSSLAFFSISSLSFHAPCFIPSCRCANVTIPLVEMYESFPIYFERLPSTLGTYIIWKTMLYMHLSFLRHSSLSLSFPLSMPLAFMLNIFIVRLLLLLLLPIVLFSFVLLLSGFLFHSLVRSSSFERMSAFMLAGRFYSAVFPVIAALSLLSL